ncbi:MAG TPA: Nif11-like leader peptide family natural product precursor [Cyanobacteria bacterium UBA11149]|nr:Nif11-like leader peptide family natural product precursor [Cyanobacteria bacterium UBA11367]HBE58454.1 Nif11-like leader peptide family natural product precursor [Cyanobacteria bacterium UBA11366]HBK62757.1 Nif11-like leader peptide family natural product precursor [Cyanobacteria bacterium UBA11166]HBR73481.1 Nif11-like leader peptide family natural product precursor [Cyanobacteria bacterium UBA11159]HBS71814.1 Nif11-like leader peptide family natural product precursor [Cyanobacteria bacter
MPKEQVTRLFRDSLANPSLKEELNTAPDVETFVLMAQERGYDFTIDEWKEMTRFTVEELKGKISEIPGI